MKDIIIGSLLLTAGVGVGYAVYPLLHNADTLIIPVTNSISTLPIAHGVTARDIASDKVSRAVNRSTPIAVEQSATSGANSSLSPQIVTQQHQVQDKLTSEQMVGFDHATQIVDQMIASQQLTHEGMAEALAILEETGQVERGLELQARILNAVDDGKLTPEQAGLTPPTKP